MRAFQNRNLTDLNERPLKLEPTGCREQFNPICIIMFERLIPLLYVANVLLISESRLTDRFRQMLVSGSRLLILLIERSQAKCSTKAE